MKKINLHTLLCPVSLVFCSILSAGAGAGTTQMNQERQSLREEFSRYAHQVNSCGETLNNLSTEAENVRQLISQRTAVCESPVTTRERYSKCVDITNEVISRTQSFQSAVSKAKELCSLFTSLSSVAQKLEAPLKSMQKNLRYIGDEGLGNIVWFFKNSEQQIYEKHKPQDCLLDLIRISKFIASPMWQMEAGHLFGDIYSLNRILSELHIIKDYALTVEKVCNADGFNLPEDNEKTQEYMQRSITKMQNKVKEITQMVDNLISKYGDIDFDTLSGKMCETLREKNRDEQGVCDFPVDTPEWAYSAQYMLFGKK